MKDKIKLFIELMLIGLFAMGIGWFIGSIIALKMSCGG
jgi:hypothetical protein